MVYHCLHHRRGVNLRGDNDSATLQVGTAVRLTGLYQQPCWYAVSTRSRQEKVVARELAAKRIEHFLPLVPRRRRWSDRYVTVHEPLFPGYVLVRIVQEYVQRVAVLECRSVVGFIGDDKGAWPIAETEVSSVKTIIQSRLECWPYPHLKKGSFVKVIHGPLAGASGILVREPRRHRLVVSISLFAQSVSVEVDVADVRSCNR
jgi:transcriptional antiterminator RfaH